jgi:hypothetical protein
VSNCNDIDRSAGVGDSVDHSVVAHANTPEILGPLNFPAAIGSRLTGESLDGAQDARGDALRKVLQLLPGGSCEGNVVLRHEADESTA